MYMTLVATLGTLILYVLVTRLIGRVMQRVGRTKEAAPERAIYITKVFNIGLAVVAFLFLCFIWGVDYRGLLVFTSSVLAVMGVAFVAQWSILSNITASIVIFFSYPSRIGDRIRILDGDNSVEGTIQDINLFQVLVRDDDGNVINYPNNLIIQKAMIRLRRPGKKPAPRLNLPGRGVSK